MVKFTAYSMAHERVGSMIPARKKLMIKVRGEARQ